MDKTPAGNTKQKPCLFILHFSISLNIRTFNITDDRHGFCLKNVTSHFMRTLTLIIIILITYACGTKSGTSDNSSSKDTVDIVSADSSLKDFAVFWRTFRKAILDKDTTTIISLTKFPIETRGPMDEDPVIKYSKNNFIKIFNLYLDQDSGLGEGSELDYIKKTDTPKKNDASGEWARIGDMQFTFSDNRWTLTFMYLIPPTIETINKNGW